MIVGLRFISVAPICAMLEQRPPARINSSVSRMKLARVSCVSAVTSATTCFAGMPALMRSPASQTNSPKPVESEQESIT